jgi:hypothetical protein
MPTCTKSQTASKADLLSQHEQALSLLCGLHPCVAIDGPPEDVAQRIFDHVIADRKALLERIKSLDQALEYFRRPSQELLAALKAQCQTD